MSPHAQLHRTLSSALLAAVVLLCQVRTAFAITYDSANNEFFETIDDWGQSSGTDKIGIRFGASLQESLVFDQALGKFILSDDLDVRGTLSGSALTIQGGNSTFLGRVGVGSAATPDTQLEVVGTISGSSLRVRNLSVSGSLAIEQGAALSGSSIQGFGLLSDCDDATTSKLLWDATTGRFSCGTDQSGSAPEVGTEAFTGGVIRIGDSRYVLTQGDTMTGGLSIDGQTDQVQLNVQGNITQSNNIVDIENYDSTANYMVIDGGGATQFFSNVTLGDSSSDTVVFNGYVSSSILPSSDLNYDLGGPSNRWGNIYGNNGYFYSVNGTYVNGTYVNGTYGTFNNVTITNLTNCNGTSTLDTDASGNVICGADDVGGNMSYFSITDGFTTEQVDNAETITFSDGTDINVSVSPTNTVTVAFTNATGYITGSNVSTYETDPVYNANVYATSMNQNVTTTSGPTFSNVTLSGMTQGSVVFAGPSGLLSQDNTMFFWDDASDRLGLGTGSPDRRLEVLDGSGNPQMRLTYTDSASYADLGVDSNGDLSISPFGGNTTFTGNVTVSALTNCDTVDTDASGNLICGTDDGGGGGISYATAEDIFVNQAGDTMTGALHIQDGNAAAASVATLLNVRGTMSGKLLHVSGTGASTAPLIATDLRFGSIVMGTGAIQDGNRRIMPQLLVKNRVPTRFIGSGSMAGNPNQLAVQGSYAYVATEGASAGLRIFDITNPNRPTSISFLTLANSPQAVAVQGQYAYLTSDPLSIVDISNPSAPRLISELDVDGASYQIAVQGSYAYVPSQVNDMLEIIDVSNPQYPQVAARINTGADPWGIAVQGKYAFVTNSAAHTMVAVDISNPKKPFIADERSTGFNPYGIAVQGRYAYVSNDNGVETYDISNPTNIPTALNAMPQDSGSFVLQADGKHLYGAQYNANSMLIADISDPTRPIRMGTIATLDFDGVVVQGRYIYGTAYGAKSLTIYDMGGAQIDQLEAGATQVGSLDVKTSATINGDIDARGTGTFGRGIHTTGPSTVHQTSTGAFASTIASATGALRLAAQGTVSQPHLQFGTGTTFDVKLFRPSARTLRTDGNLQVVNVLSGATVYATRSFSGAGLSASTDCDNATTSKLLWDASTGRFSCGTDQSGGAAGIVSHYVLASGDTMTGTLTIDVAGENTTGLSVSGATILNSSGKNNDISMYDGVGNLLFFADASLRQIQIGDGGGPEYKFDVYDTSGTWSFKVGGSSAGQQLRLGDDEIGSFNAGDTAALFINPNGGNVGVGKTTAKAALDVLGTMSGTVVRGQRTLASSGTLVFEGAASGASLYLGTSLNGVGLSDCDNATTSKLLWDATTGRFSCGTDQGGAGGSPGGSDTHVQYNDSAAFGGEAAFTWNETADRLDVRGTMSGSVVHAASRLASSGVLVLRPGNQSQPTLYANGGQQVGVNTASPHSSFTSSGTFATTVRVVTATGAINGGDQIIFASGSSMISLTLPTAVGINGRQYTIKKTSATNGNQIRPVIVKTTSSQTIDRVSQWRLTNRGQQVTVVSDGANWQVVDASGYGLNGGYVSMGTTMNQWYGAPADATALTTAVLTTTATIRVTPFIAQKVMTINGMSISVQTTAASAEVRLALYNDTGRGYPDTLVVDAGTVVNTSTGHRTICPSGCTTTGAGTLPVTIQPGLYWLAINNNSIAHTLRGFAVANLNPISGFPNAYTTLRNVGWQVANAYGAYPTQFPSNATATTAVPIPAVTVRIQE